MAGLDAAIKPSNNQPQVPDANEKPDGLIARVYKFGRPGRDVLFDAPGVNPTVFRMEPLNREERDSAKLAAYAWTVDKLGVNLRGRVEDTDIYDDRLILEVLYRGIKNPENPVKSGNLTRYYPATQTPDDFKALTNDQISYLYNQLQIVTAEFQPTRVQMQLMQNLEKFCEQCAEAVADMEAGKESDFPLVLASLSWQELVSVCLAMGANLHDFLVPLPAQSNSPTTSESSAESLDGNTTSSTESPSPTSSVLSSAEAVQRVIENSKHSPSRSGSETVHEPDGQAAAEDLASELSGNK